MDEGGGDGPEFESSITNVEMISIVDLAVCAVMARKD